MGSRQQARVRSPRRARGRPICVSLRGVPDRPEPSCARRGAPSRWRSSSRTRRSVRQPDSAPPNQTPRSSSNRAYRRACDRVGGVSDGAGATEALRRDSPALLRAGDSADARCRPGAVVGGHAPICSSPSPRTTTVPGRLGVDPRALFDQVAEAGPPELTDAVRDFGRRDRRDSGGVRIGPSRGNAPTTARATTPPTDPSSPRRPDCRGSRRAPTGPSTRPTSFTSTNSAVARIPPMNDPSEFGSGSGSTAHLIPAARRRPQISSTLRRVLHLHQPARLFVHAETLVIERSRGCQPTPVGSIVEPRWPGIASPLLVLIFLVAAAATWISRHDALEDAPTRSMCGSGWGEELGGLLLLSVAGSLPEIAITVSAVISGTPRRSPPGNLIGGIAMQTAVLILCDVAVGERRPPPDLPRRVAAPGPRGLTGDLWSSEVVLLRDAVAAFHGRDRRGWEPGVDRDRRRLAGRGSAC